MRRLWIFPVLLALLWFPELALSEQVEQGGLCYDLSTEAAYIVGYVPGAETVVLPAQVSGLPVRKGLQAVLEPPDSVTSLVIQEGVTAIENSMFSNLPNLQRIDFPSTLLTIGDSAFSGALSLQELTLPEGLQSIGAFAFAYCDGLRAVHLPASLTTLGETALAGTPSLQAFDLAEGSTMFQVVDGVLLSADGATLLRYPSAKGESYTVPSTVRTIGPRAFTSNPVLKHLTLPEGVVSLKEWWLWYRGMALETLSIPASLTDMEARFLPNGPTLRRVDIAPGHPRYHNANNLVLEGEMLAFVPEGLLSVDVPEGVTSIDQAFMHNRNVVSVTLPRSLTQLQGSAFYDCTSLERVSLPITLKEIGYDAFANCISLSSITLPPGLQRLGASVFSNCPELRSITLPDQIAVKARIISDDYKDDVVIYASYGSNAFWSAWGLGYLWAEPGGTPQLAYNAARSRETWAVVSNPSIDETTALRAEPSPRAKVLGKYGNGVTVAILDEEKGYLQVRVGETVGYMESEALRRTDDFKNLARIQWGRRVGRNDGGPVTLFHLPEENASHEIITGDRNYQILDTVGTWYHVRVAGHDRYWHEDDDNEDYIAGVREGYVRVQDLEIAALMSYPSYDGTQEDVPSVMVVVNPASASRLHLRAEPDVESASLGRYFNGTQVEILEQPEADSQWVHVQVDEKQGYMLLEFLRRVEYSWDGNDALWGNG